MTQRPAELIVRHDFTLISPKKSECCGAMTSNGHLRHLTTDRWDDRALGMAKALRRLSEGGAHLGVEAQSSLDDPIADLLHWNFELQRLEVSLPESSWTLELDASEGRLSYAISRLVQTKCTRFHGKFLAVKICQDRRRY